MKKCKQLGGDTKQLMKDINNPIVTDNAIIYNFKTGKHRINESLKPIEKILHCFPEYKTIKYDWIDAVADGTVIRPKVIKYLLDNSHIYERTTSIDLRKQYGNDNFYNDWMNGDI